MRSAASAGAMVRRGMFSLHLAVRRGSSETEGLAQDLLHDLVGPAADRAQARVARHALDLVLLHVAGAAMDLQAGVHDVEARPLRDELGHRDLLHRVLA